MAKTHAQILLGEDMEGGEVFCDDIYNYLKNHWRADYTGDPCAVLTEQLGMIISDAHDDRLYHITTGPVCTEIVQGDIPVSDEVAVILGDDSDGSIYYDEAVNNELVLEAKNAANVEGVTVSLLETNQRFRIRQNADYMAMYLTAADAYLTWSDGALNLQTDEADTNSVVHIHGAGTGYGILHIYDADNAEYLQIFSSAGKGYISTIGVAPGELRFQRSVATNIDCWQGIVAGNPNFRIYGWVTAGGARRFSQFRMDDANDEFLIEAENNANHEGITINLLETNQQFRVRQNADYIAMYLDGSHAYLTWSDGTLYLQTDETDTNTTIAIRGEGTGFGTLQIFDEDNLERLEMHSSGGVGFIGVLGTAPSYLHLQFATPSEIRCWRNIAAGNPSFAIYGYITAGVAVRRGTFRVDDTWDEFVIESENNANLEGVSISLLETNQRFRVRQNSDYMAMYCTATDAYLVWSDGALNLQTEEADASSAVHIHGNGTGYGVLSIYDEDDAEQVILQATAQSGYLKIAGVAPSAFYFQYDVAAAIRCWAGIAAGNPAFYIYGYITAGAAVRYGRFLMEDTYDEFFIETENNANHEGITVSLLEAAQEFRLRGIGGAERFHIDQTGILGYMRQGELFQWTYQGDLADDASFNLPAFTDACWGFIQAGDNEEYALFSVDNVGNVTLITNSANVVANANTDGKLCLGIASPEEPLTIRNRLGATENINLIIWYS